LSLLSITALTIRVAGRTLLEGADLSVEPGRRVGLVGRNGAGKSTLLATILGERQADGGEIRIATRARVATVRQEAPEGPASLIDCVLEGDQERLSLLMEAECGHAERLAEVHERLRAIEADAAPARAGAILAGLGFDAAAQARAVSTFSGGWRMRVALATALFAAPDLLLLDEPTNHLDLEATMWLEGWLQRFAGAVVIVSHDRALLDNAVHVIAHLDRGRIKTTPGGYSEFVRIRTEHALQQGREAQRIAARRAHMQDFVDRFRAKATKARQAQARLKALARMPAIDTVVEAAPTRFEFPSPAPLAPPMLTLDRVSCGYDGVAVLRGLSLRLDNDDRIALLGPNGRGKSTFAKLLAGRLAPMGGKQFRASGLGVGYFAQHQTDELEAGQSPLWHMQRAMPAATVTQVRGQLARFGLDAERAETPSSELSGGERARLLLALATRDAPQLLILDEPTNHLDIDARDALVRALADFEGAVLLISHDPHLVELVADRLWIVGDGTVTPFDGDLDDYKARIAEAGRTAPASGKGERSGGVRDERRERALARAAVEPLRRRVREAEATLARLATERGTIETRLADPALYATGRGAEVTRENVRLGAIARAAAKAEEDWLEAEAALEAAGSGAVELT
jgi:ATP-binding cassette subfamily F protein 3